ncbi:uncharacterized protein [Coffea arabica]|uniref:Uncharacterized protein n=1 Tax=Coffea arabica TaxID=13443 RepID=A0A6P6VFW2_COFAR
MPIFYFLSSSLISLFTSSSFQSSSNFSHLLPLFFSLVFFFWFLILTKSNNKKKLQYYRSPPASRGLRFRPSMTSFMRPMFSTETPSISYSGLQYGGAFSLFSCSSSKLQCLHQALQSNTLQNSC